VIEDFLAEHLEDGEVVLADVHIFGGGLADVVDKGPPAIVPLIFYNLDQDRITFGQNVVHRPAQVVHRPVLQDLVHDVVL
jgi:hypothetical protein